jgi:hypothetical protein
MNHRYAFFKMLLLAAQTYKTLEPRIGAFIKGRAGETNVDGSIEQTRSDQVVASRVLAITGRCALASSRRHRLTPLHAHARTHIRTHVRIRPCVVPPLCADYNEHCWSGQPPFSKPIRTSCFSRTILFQAFRMVAKLELMLLFVMWGRVASTLSWRAITAAIMYSQFTVLRFTSVRNPRSREAWASLRATVRCTGRTTTLQRRFFNLPQTARSPPNPLLYVRAAHKRVILPGCA